MITAEQFRAARAILNLKQSEVAEATGLNVNTITSIEKGESAKAETILRLEAHYVANQIEFLDSGVRIRQGLRTYNGSDGFRTFMDDVYNVARSSYGEICIFNGLPKKMVEFLGQDFYEAHAKRMAAIKRRFTFKVIVEEGEDSLIGSSFAEYRTIPSIQDKMIYIYGDRTAFIDFTDGPKIVVIEGANVAESMKVMFEAVWKTLT